MWFSPRLADTLSVVFQKRRKQPPASRAVKYIGIFDGKTETRHRIESLDHIYDHSERIRAIAKAYATGAVKELPEVV